MIIIPLLLMILALWLNEIVSKHILPRVPLTKLRWLDDRGVRETSTLFMTSTLLFILFGEMNLWLLLSVSLASVLIVGLNKLILLPLSANRSGLSFYLGEQVSMIILIYLALYLFGQTESPAVMWSQFQLLLFSDNLRVDQGLIVPAFLLIVVFLTSISSEIVKRLLDKFGNPASASRDEVAATIEHSSELIRSGKIKLLDRIQTDAVIEEQLEMADDTASPKTKESIKVQYLLFNREADASSKGKYIGILERLLIGLFVFQEIYQGMVLLGAMKTLARFKMFESKAFAEYYLIGTLSSLLIATICGFLLRRIV